MVARAVPKVYEQVKSSARPELPIIWSEYNAGFDGVQLDGPYVGPWLANNIRLCAGGLVTEMSYWTFTDAFFEEGGVFRSVFSSGFGLIATSRVPKASFNQGVGTNGTSSFSQQGTTSQLAQGGRVAAGSNVETYGTKVIPFTAAKCAGSD
jgi:hypothetical protein